MHVAPSRTRAVGKRERPPEHFGRRRPELDPHIKWAPEEVVATIVAQAYEARHTCPPTTTIDRWMEARFGTAGLTKREFRMRTGQVYDAYLLYTRDQHAGGLPRTVNPHSSSVERITLICANPECGQPFDVLPSEKTAGRKYCGPPCAARGWSQQFYESMRADLGARNREIFRRHQQGDSIKDLAMAFDLSTNWIRRILKRIEEAP